MNDVRQGISLACRAAAFLREIRAGRAAGALESDARPGTLRLTPLGQLASPTTLARYFKYKSPGELQHEASLLGHELLLSADLTSLFQPVQIGPLTAGNRLVIQPMEGCDGTPEGAPGELTFRRYERFGGGGAKLIWAEATAVCPEARANSRQLLAAPEHKAELARLLQVCRQAHRARAGNDGDLVVGLQLTHSGRYSVPSPIPATHDPVLDPLTIDRNTGRALDSSYPLISDDQLHRLEDGFVAAARLAADVGFDFVDLKQCHRYLLSELLAAKNRPGPFGGSLENRTRLIRNVVGRIRAEVKGLTLATRINCFDGIPFRAVTDDAGERVGRPCPHELPLVASFGTNPYNPFEEDLAEPMAVVRMLAEAGVALFNVSMGNPYANPHVVRPAEYPPVDGYHCPEHPLLGVLRHFRVARAMQQALPGHCVVGSGYSWLQEFAPLAAAANVAAGHVALVGFGRAALSHPDFAQSLGTTGALDRKRVCRTFSYCTGLMRAKNHPLGQFPTGCPPFDKAVYGPIWKEAEQQRTKAP
jgi:2,4-dienoyl-CoA reductase-like NADH-dependent reductase (Old Yellow Enzyme family)